MSPLCEDTKMAIAKIKHESEKSEHVCNVPVTTNEYFATLPGSRQVEEQIRK